MPQALESTRPASMGGQTIIVNIIPLLDDKGEIRQIMGLTYDITERKRAEDALREGEERLLIAKEAAQLGIHDYDIASGTIQWDARVRELWGVGPDMPITYDLFMSGLHPDDRAPMQAAVDRAFDPKGSGRYYAEYRVINLIDGIERWVAATGRTFFNGDKPMRLIGTVQDITERKHAEEEMRRRGGQGKCRILS